jgi:hypothetical protein
MVTEALTELFEGVRKPLLPNMSVHVAVKQVRTASPTVPLTRLLGSSSRSAWTRAT